MVSRFIKCSAPFLRIGSACELFAHLPAETPRAGRTRCGHRQNAVPERDCTDTVWGGRGSNPDPGIMRALVRDVSPVITGHELHSTGLSGPDPSGEIASSCHESCHAAARPTDVCGGDPDAGHEETVVDKGDMDVVNGQPGLAVQQDGVTVTVLAFDIDEDRIAHIWAVLNPDKLQRWS